MWQVPNPGNPRNYKRGGFRALLDPPIWLKIHPPEASPTLQLISHIRGLICTMDIAWAEFAWFGRAGGLAGTPTPS